MKLKTLLFGALAFFALNTMAETITEGFESVTLTNADTWGRATQLSNGWKIQGGYISTSASSNDYGFWTTAYNGSSKSLTAQYGGTNNAYVIIPVLLSGDVTFYYRKTSSDSRSAGKVYAYKVSENEGTYTIGTRIFMDESATTSWQQCTSIKLTEPTMIAFKMVRAAMDDVTYTTASLEPHEHDYASEWSYDENEHWHACTSEVGICDAKKTDVAAHDGLTCSICGYKTPGIESFPWTEDFEGITSGIPAGWDNSEGTTTTASYKWNYYSKSVRFDSYNNSEGKTNVLATPLIYIPAEGVYELKFKVKNPTGGNYEVKIAEYGSADRTTLFDNLTGIAAWTEKTASLEAYRGKAVKVYFCGTSNWGSGDAYLYLDDVIVKESIAHDHDYADVWSYDYTSHWHACLSEVGECNAPKGDLAEHTLNGSGICTICGYDQPYMEDFEGGIPASWTNKGWTIADAPSNGNGTKMAYAGGYGTSNTLVTPNLEAKAGDIIEIQALQQYTDEYLTLEYSTDGGETWTQGFSEVPAANNTLHTLYFTAPEEGVYLLRFSGRYNYIDNICGFKLAKIPVMEVSTTDGASREGNVFTDNFGRQTANASHTYTVANTGAASLRVNISSNNEAFCVSASTLTVAAGESKTFDLTFVHGAPYEDKNAVVTISPVNMGLTNVTINASAVCADPEEFFEDFENGIPVTWTNTGWTVQTKNGSKMAYSYVSDAVLLVTPMLTASEGDVLTFDAFQQWDDEPLKLEYSLNGGDWVVAFEEGPAANNTARQFTFTAEETGEYQLRFSGSYNYIDNVVGFKLAPITRNTTNDKFGTICLPCAADVEGAELYTAELSTEGAWLVLNEAAEFEAGVPYIYQATADAQSFKMKGASVNAPVNTGILKGIFKETTATAGTYVMQTHGGVQKFYLVEAGSEPTLAPYRAYLDVPSNARTIGWNMGDEETAIEVLNAAVERGQIYDLNGRKLNRLQKGINIVNGRTVLVK